MAYDATMQIGLIAEVDEKQLQKATQKIATAVHKAKPMAGGSNIPNSIAQTIMGYMATGKFPTTASAARYMRQLAGGSFSQQEMSLWTMGEAQARQINKVLKKMDFDLPSIGMPKRGKATQGIVGAYNEFASAYNATKAAPTEEGISALLSKLQEIRNGIAELGKNSKNLTKPVREIKALTKDVDKNMATWKTATTPSGTANALGAGAYITKGLQGILKIFGLGTAIGAAKKWIDFGISGTKEGSADLAEQAMYGASRNIAIGRSRAKMYGLEESVTAAPERYALDFRQRMMWGEVSDKEWIALSRMGDLGRMIISGQAGQNPEAFQRELEKWIESNRGNEAMVRQTLSWLGLSPQLMKYGAIKYSEEDKGKLEGAYTDFIKTQKDAAAMVWKSADEFNKFLDSLKAGSASLLATLVDTPEGRARLAQAYALAGYSDAERRAVIEAAKSGPEKTRLGLFGKVEPLSNIGEKLGYRPASFIKNALPEYETAPQIYVNVYKAAPDTEVEVLTGGVSRRASYAESTTSGGD